MNLRKLISIALSFAIAVTTLSVVAGAKSEKIEDVPIATENVELAEPEKMVSDSFCKVPKLVLRSIDILINIGGANKRTTFVFGNDSIVTGVKYNGVEKILYTYDLLKRQTKKTLNTTVPFTTSYEYKNIDNYRTSTLIDRISYSDGTALSYTYDANGNILTIADATGTVIASYTYDSLNQLTGATVGSDVYTYTYDNGGNIVSKTKNGVEVAYTYGNNEWKDLLTNYNGVDITYDTIGNPLNWINGETFTWGGGRQLTGIVKGDNTISYTYNDNGIRTSKTVNGVRTDYYLNGTAIIMQKTGDNVIWYTYDENGNIAGMNYNGSDYWFYRNAQNDVIGIIDSSGSVVAKYTYDDWGKVVNVIDGQGNDLSSDTTHIANINPIRYRGYYYDMETGLYYLQSRYYDAEVGRFINADGYMSTGQGVLGHNMFAYCGNNPISRNDKGGRFWIFAIIAVACIGAIGVTLTGCSKNSEPINTISPTSTPSSTPSPSATKSNATPTATIPSGGVSVYKGRPRICTDGSKGDMIPDNDWNAYTAYSKWSGDTAKVLDAYAMPYVVIPKGNTLTKKGEVAYLVNHDNGASVRCIIGEVGSADNGWGEVSIAAIWDTGYPNHRTANNASGITENYEIIVFPGVSYNYDWSWGYNIVEGK